MDDLPLQKLAEQSNSKKADAERLAAEVTRLEVHYRREKAALQAELQAARERLGRVRYLVAQGAEPLEAQQLARRQGREAERQLVRSPVSGRVAEVRVREVTARGVTVEVVVLGEPK